MVEALKKFYNEHNVVCDSPFGQCSYRLMSINMWLKGGKIVGILDDFKDDDIYAVVLMNQETNKQLIVEYKQVKKMSILKRQIKFYLKDDSHLSIKY